MTGRVAYILSLLFVVALVGNALALSVTTSVDKQVVGLGDPLTLKISVLGDGASAPDPKLPDLSNFEIYSSGRNQNISIVQGKFSSTLEMSYILIPKKIGDLMIGPVTVSDKKNMAASDPIKIKVTKPGEIPETKTDKRTSTSGQRTQRREDFFIEQSIDNSRPYVGQQATLTFKFFQAETLWENPDLQWPEYVGFTVEDLPPNSRQYEIVNGRRYLVTEIKRALFPISSGEITIESPQLRMRSDGVGRDPFSIFNRRRPTTRQPKILTTNPIKLNVRALPKQSRPESFTGAVGEYRINLKVSKDSVGVDEPVTMTVRLSGKGNIKSIPAIKMPELENFRVYESGSTESINNTNRVVSGQKTFEQALIPTTTGEFEIPSLEYSFFNPKKKRYVTVKTDPVKIIASGEGLTDVGGAPRNIIGADQKSLGYIIAAYPGLKNGIDLYSSFWYWLLQVIPLLGIIAAIAVRSHYRKLIGDQNYARKIFAKKRYKIIFKSALAKKETKDFNGFYGEIFNAVLGFVSDKLSLDKSSLTIDDIRNLAQLDSEIGSGLADFLDQCQTARYSPSNLSVTAANQTLEEAESMLSKLEKVL
jgi:hypothetical protein